MKLSMIAGYFALAAIAAGIVMNLRDVRRYVRISTM